MRRRLLLLPLLLLATTARAQTTPFPYADGVEDTTAAKNVWTPSGTTGSRFYTSTAGVNARTGTKAWRVGPGGTITLRAPVSLAGRLNPHFAVWTRAISEVSGTPACADCGTVHLEVSPDGGTTWETVVPTTPMGPADGDYPGGPMSSSKSTAKMVWKRMQWPLDGYVGSSVRLRLRYGTGVPGGYALALDDILVDEAPVRLVAGASGITNRSFTVSWPASTAPDFARYRVVVSTSPDYNGFNYIRDIYNPMAEYFVFGVQNPYPTSLRVFRSERRVRDVTVQGQTSVTFDSLGFAGMTYYARVYEVDQQGFMNQGSETVEQRTTLNYGPAVRGPFTETFDAGTTPPGWILEPTWAVSNEASAEAGHSAPGVLSDSPGGNYGTRALQYATVRVNLSSVKRPLLRFKHRYNMFNDTDIMGSTAGRQQSGGIVMWSRDGQTWNRLTQFSSTSTWKAEEFDLSEMGGAGDGYLRFVLYSETTLRDGWLLDDVEVGENARVTAFPFRDDAEGTISPWILGTNARTSIAGAHSGTGVWQFKQYQYVNSGGVPQHSVITLAGTMDLRGVKNPVMSLWTRGLVSGEMPVDVSADGGRTWKTIARLNAPGSEWTRQTVSLEGYQSASVLLRIGGGWYGPPQIDDIEITGTAPGPVSSGTVEFQIYYPRSGTAPALQSGDQVGVRASDQSPLTYADPVLMSDFDGDRVYTARVPFSMPLGTRVNYDFVVVRSGAVVASDPCGRSFVYGGSATVNAGWGHWTGFDCEPSVRPGEAVGVYTISGGGAPGGTVLTTGFHPQATTGLDEAYGEKELPPTPPEGTFTARFTSGEGASLGQGSLVDLRPGTADFSGTLTHHLTLQRASGTGDFTFAYDLPDRVRARLRDGLTGSLFSQSFAGRGSFGIPSTGNMASVTRFALELTYGETCVDAAALAAGWNMISAPLTAASMAPGTLFPGTTSPFGYDNGYTSASAFVPGRGYWAKAEGTFTASPRHCGTPVAAYDTPLKAGWNMIGGFEFTAETSRLVATPADVVSSAFFGYANGYTTATSLVPGRGYWVRAKSDGSLRVVPSGAAHAGDPSMPDAAARSDAPAGDGVTLTVEDARGQRATLRLVATPDGRAVLPPLPPDGLFDARFVGRGDGSAEGDASGTTLALQGAAYPVTVSARGLAPGQTLRLADALGRPLATLTGTERVTLASGERFSLAATGGDLPTEVALAPAQPNPSRGTATQLRYALPEAARVRLAVYDVLGREVVRLVDGEMPAGAHAAVLESGELPSGLYVVRMTANGRTLTRTLVVNR